VRLHDARHAHATWLLKGGTPIEVVSERLGHSRVSITLDTYSHALPDWQDAAVAAVEGMLAEGTA
jgi:integrase